MFYKLNDDHTIEPCSFMEWGEYFQSPNNRSVGRDRVEDKLISTVWLGTPHGFNEAEEPLLFETMVFLAGNWGNDIYCDRYPTHAEALAGHERAIQWVKDGCKDVEQD